MAIHKNEQEQSRAEMLKIIRAAIRLKHSIAADRELNEALPKAEAFFDARRQRGVLPSPAEVKKAVGL